MLCRAMPSRQAPRSRGWGRGDASCRFPVAARMELPSNCRVEAKQEQSGSCRDPHPSPLPKHRAQRAATGSPAAAPRPLPPSCPGAAAGPRVCRGRPPGDGGTGTGTCRAVPGGCGVGAGPGASPGGPGAAGPGRGGARHPAGRGHVPPCPAPAPALACRPGTARSQPGRQRGGGGAGSCPDLPGPARGAAPGVPAPGWGVPHPPPAFSHAAMRGAGAGVGAGAGHPTPEDVSPHAEGTPGGGHREGGVLCAPGGPRGCVRGQGVAV